jgi:hypothetical protein
VTEVKEVDHERKFYPAYTTGRAVSLPAPVATTTAALPRTTTTTTRTETYRSLPTTRAVETTTVASPPIVEVAEAPSTVSTYAIPSSSSLGGTMTKENIYTYADATPVSIPSIVSAS